MLKNLKIGILATVLVWTNLGAFARPVPEAGPRTFSSDSSFLDYVEKQTFRFFWEESNSANGLIRDRSRPDSPCSIASVGFGLSAINVAIERGWVDRTNGTGRVLKTLRTLCGLPQGGDPAGCAGYHGWFYHFLDMNTGLRAGHCELSTIDTALLMMGVIDAAQFFTNPAESAEAEIRHLAGALVSRIDWPFMLWTNEPVMLMGWTPERGYGPGRWAGHNEAACLYVLGLGAATPALPAKLWEFRTRGYECRQLPSGESYVFDPSLFTHQYSEVWIDFRAIADAYMTARKSDYFENSRRATLAQRQYSLENRPGYPNYGPDEWGFTACDGPGVTVGGVSYAGYIARGAPAGFEDGTIAPTAAGGSVPFAPDICMAALRHFYDTYVTNLWTTEGFRDAYNIRANWWDDDLVGIDQGPIVLMSENYRSGSTWSRMLSSPIIQRGLERAGFTAPPPDRLQAKAVAINQVELSWRNNAAYQTGIRVESSTDGAHFIKAAEVGANVTKTVVPVSPSEVYYFRLRAASAAGLSGFRETVTVRPAPAVAGLKSSDRG